MISFNHLGNLGHLGNQMFQFAALVGLGAKHERNFCIPPYEAFGKAYYQPLRSNIYDAFQPRAIKKLTKFPTLQEAHFHFDENLFENLPEEDVNLYGFFQSEKYFAHCKDRVRDHFRFDKETKSLATLMRQQLSGKILGIHVRRTDYLTNPNHHSLGLDYYERALAEMPDVTGVIFTDDTEWAMKQKLFPDERFFVSEMTDPYIDLCLMSLCNYHIIGNSSYSWWGAWLAESERVIAPKHWFAGDAAAHDTKDLYLPDWLVL